MRGAIALVLLVGCSHPSTTTTTPEKVVAHDPDPPPAKVPSHAPKSSVASLTPSAVLGAVLGQPFDQLKRGRPMISRDPERYDFREHYVETLDSDGISTVHYYTMNNEGVMYQISLDFTVDGAAEAMFANYEKLGSVIDDLGGKEIVISGYPFEIRIWQGDKRVQFMAVIEGTEWWDEYHPSADPNGDPNGVDGDDDDDADSPPPPPKPPKSHFSP